MAVIKTNDKEFKSQLEENDKVIIKYFANWCGTCRLFAPKFRRMSEEEQNKDITFLDINAEENPGARKWAGITNLPFFAVVKNGKILEGDYTAKEDAVKAMVDKLHKN